MIAMIKVVDFIPARYVAEMNASNHYNSIYTKKPHPKNISWLFSDKVLFYSIKLKKTKMTSLLR